MILSAIVAVADNLAIGKDNQLPWHLPEDLKFFKRTTLGKPVIMGRKTFESLGRPLPGRLNIVLTKQAHPNLPDGVQHYADINEVIRLLEQQNTEEAFIIGGGEIFKETLEQMDRLYITQVHTSVDNATAFFPHVDHAQWKLTWEEDHGADDKHKYAYTFQKWERLSEV